MAAPRLRASTPTAPVPANKSSHSEPSSAEGFPAVRTLNRVSRSRSEVGLISTSRHELRRRLRNFPAIIRMVFSLRNPHSTTRGHNESSNHIRLQKKHADLVYSRGAD